MKKLEIRLTPEDEVRILKDMGNRLKSIRKIYGLNQAELAYRAGFSRSYYSDIETGKRNISILNLFKLSEALDVSITELVDFENIPSYKE